MCGFYATCGGVKGTQTSVPLKYRVPCFTDSLRSSSLAAREFWVQRSKSNVECCHRACPAIASATAEGHSSSRSDLMLIPEIAASPSTGSGSSQRHRWSLGCGLNSILYTLHTALYTQCAFIALFALVLGSEFCVLSSK